MQQPTSEGGVRYLRVICGFAAEFVTPGAAGILPFYEASVMLG